MPTFASGAATTPRTSGTMLLCTKTNSLKKATLVRVLPRGSLSRASDERAKTIANCVSRDAGSMVADSDETAGSSTLMREGVESNALNLREVRVPGPLDDEDNAGAMN